ncbi:unnamed protein product [Schistosoma margrebowiei]|uniref:Reverse transcriptase domain-containing protein n=1 Tax=Schistosoma margrebowiei TaxID=48269 RepID=A0A3P7ZAJ9_9TREM|nr:unnamed protein product [Schistosoma margrebowiei]
MFKFFSTSFFFFTIKLHDELKRSTYSVQSTEVKLSRIIARYLILSRDSQISTCSEISLDENLSNYNNSKRTDLLISPLFTQFVRTFLCRCPKKAIRDSTAHILSTIFRVLLNRMKDSVDTQLRDQQAGFRKDRSCTDQISTLRIIVEQSVEWNSSLYINFIDYEKSFDSMDRTTLCRFLQLYGVPEKIVNIIQNSYDGLNCKIVHTGQLTDSFEVKTGVRQGCLLSPFLFLLVIDWIMETSTSGGEE